MATSEHEVIVVGAGAAGLAAGTYLRLAGRDVVVLEAEARVGGRLTTSVQGGWRLDRGFHVVLEGYPELRRLVPVRERQFPQLFAGVGMLEQGNLHVLADPRRVPATWRTSAATLVALVRGAIDPAALGRLVTRRGATVADVEAVLPRALRNELVAPFLRGVLLAPDGDVPIRVAWQVLRGFLAGGVSLPPGGIATLAEVLAEPLAGLLRLEAPVEAVASGLVRLAGGEELRAEEIIVAVGPETAARLLGSERYAAARWRAQGYAHLATEEVVLELPLVALPPASQPIWTVATVSDVDPTRRPVDEDRSLVTVSFDPTLAPEDLRAALARVAPALAGAEVLEVGVVEHALPVLERPAAIRPARGITLAGDWTAAPSLDGALSSGRRAAELVLRALGQRATGLGSKAA